MHSALLFICTIFIAGCFGQNDTVPKIDLNIIVSEQDNGTPIVNAKITVVGSDGTTRIGYTDKNGRLDYLYTDSLAIKPNVKYTLEVEGILKGYLGTGDAFSTVGITANTRIVRDLKVLRMICGLRPPGVIFTLPESVTLDSAAIFELEYVMDFFIRYPKLILIIEGVYDKPQEVDLAWRRVYVVQEKLVGMGVGYDQLVLQVSERIFSEDYYRYPESYRYEENVDVMFKILSFE